MIYSKVRTQEELQEHMAYLGEKYVKYWALWTQGFHVIPVIGKKSIERLFEINIQDKTMCGMMPYPDSGFEPACPIAGVVYNKIGFVSPERRYEAPTVARPPQM